MREPAPVHYLRPNDKVWTPPSVLFLDTETRRIEEPGRDVQTMRVWSAHYVDRKAPTKASPREEWADGLTPDELADWVDKITRNRSTVWLFCHNLSFDLPVTRLPVQLVARGWTVSDAAIGGRAPWMRLGKGKRILTMVDSASWFPKPLEEIAKLVGIPKPKLPTETDQLALWHARCRADVAIMEAAVLQLLDWWDQNELGRFNISGPACGWNAYRHRETVDRVVIDPTQAFQDQDRLCYHGGRRGTWTIGEHNAGPFTELDFVAAYPTVAAELPLPMSRAYQFESLPIDHRTIGSERWGITARVRVRTDVPRWPLRIGGSTWYPVGEFWTHLAGPDIAEARRLGCLLEIGEGWAHRLGYAMAPWAQWVLNVQNGYDPTAPQVARVAAKAWGRSVIGKWAARGYEKIKLGPAPASGWGYEEGWDHNSGVHGGMVDLGGTRWWVAATGQADNAYPAIPAWVESEVRVRLNRVIEALGPGAVMQCDTDGMIIAERTVGTVAAHGHLVAPPSVPAAGRLQWCLDQIDPVAAPLVLRAKRRLAHVTILGPQHLVRDGHRRFAGLPGMAQPIKACSSCGADEDAGCGCGAELVDPGDRFKVKLWPKLQWQLANGDRRGYVNPETRPRIKGPWPTGWVLGDRSVVPVEAYIGRDGQTKLIDWNRSSYAAAGRRPTHAQHPRLAPLF